MTRGAYAGLYAGLFGILLIVTTTGFDLVAFQFEPQYTGVKAVEAYIIGLGLTLILAQVYLWRDLVRLLEQRLPERRP